MDIYAITTQEILDKISRHCPEAMSIYIQCLNRADKEGKVFFTRSLVEIDMSESWTTFQRNIKKLALENLLEWHPFNKGIAVTLAEVHDDD